MKVFNNSGGLRLTAVSDGEGTTAYSYDALSNITRISYPNGASIKYSYDVMNRPLLVVNKDARDKKADVFGYVYDPAGMVTKMMQEGGAFVEYRYDALNRLVRETKKQESRKQDAKIKYDYQYSYDSVGNRVELIKHKDGEDSKQIKETSSYDAGNRLLGLTRNKEKDGLPVLAEAIHYNYDNNGNRMSKIETKPDDDGTKIQTIFYNYDYENRLTALEYVGRDSEDIPSASFEYDGNGIRRKAVEGDAITRYYYDGLNVLFEKNAAGLTQKSYTRGLGFPGGIGGLISMKRHEIDDGLEEKTSYYHYDAPGSVRGLSNEKGKLNAEFEYDAFGNGKNNKKWNTYRFSSKEFEDHASLYYFGARYYDPELGRWLTPDPLGFIDGPNVYAYVGNNPVNFIDEYGLFGERLNQIQIGLDTMGVFDPTPISDGINALIYVTRGEWGYAGISILATVPYLGDVAKGGKYAGKLSEHVMNSIKKRGWSEEQIIETINHGKKYPAIDKTKGGQPATRFVHPQTGKSVVVNNTTGEIIHVGAKGFKY